MSKHFFDYNNRDYVHSVSDNMAMDMDFGDIHFISSWSADEEDDG